jgi:rhodanese-related sulfurtransferase
MTEPRGIPVEELSQHTSALIIDVRDDDKWEAGHIPGAIHIHKSNIAEQAQALLTNKNAEIICYCGGGRSGPMAAEYLTKQGYKNVSYLIGGYRSFESYTP